MTPDFYPDTNPTLRIKEEEVVSLAVPDTVVEQPSVSKMIAEQLGRGRQEEEEVEDKEEQKEKEVKKEDKDVISRKDTEEDEQIRSDLDSDKNQSFHISGENINLDDLDENIEKPHDEAVSESEEVVNEDDPDVVFSKKLRGGELDTTTVITTMLSELASDSRETSVGR